MTDAERVQALLDELLSDPDYSSGTKAFPTALVPADALTLTRKVHNAVDRGTTARAQLAVQEGMKIACGPGCSHCCAQLVMVWLPEAMRVADFLRQPENAETRQAFLETYPRWKEQVGDGPERIADLTAQQKTDEHLREHIAYWRKGVMCAFNREGLCTVYEARPVVCRTCHALDTNEHCRGYTSHTIPAGIKFEPLDNFVHKASSIHSAMHHALGGGARRSVALCQAVYEMLQSDEK